MIVVNGERKVIGVREVSKEKGEMSLLCFLSFKERTVGS
jgi:hypothetical protein